MAHLASGVDGSKDQDIRRCMLRIKRLAERCRCTIIMLRHLNKGNASNPLYRGVGSIGIIGSARTGLLVAVDPDDDTGRILAPLKSNLSRLAPSLKFRLEVHSILNVCRVAWTGTSPHRADRLIQPTPTAEQRAEIEEVRTKEETCHDYLPRPTDSCYMSLGRWQRQKVTRILTKAGFGADRARIRVTF